MSVWRSWASTSGHCVPVCRLREAPPPQGAERGVLRELRVDGVLRSSLDRRGLDLTFEDPPLGYEILDTDQRRKGSGPEKAPTRLLTGGKSYGRRQAQ